MRKINVTANVTFSTLSSSMGARYFSMSSFQKVVSLIERKDTGPFFKALSSIQNGFMSSFRSTLASGIGMRRNNIKKTKIRQNLKVSTSFD